MDVLTFPGVCANPFWICKIKGGAVLLVIPEILEDCGSQDGPTEACSPTPRSFLKSLADENDRIIFP